jgi:16S rRNA (cytosine1402-N4)-methyltransferase
VNTSSSNESGSSFGEITDPTIPRKRRTRYSGKNPRSFEQKYKELQPEKYPDTIAKVLASGKTPAGSHIPIMVKEILDILEPSPGKVFVDCTLGYGGHAREILAKIQPGGLLIGLDTDPLELPKTEARLRRLGYEPETFKALRSNFAGIRRALTWDSLKGVDGMLADLGVSSMQLDTPSRGFSLKLTGPLDMRMNPDKGIPASQLLAKASAEELQQLLEENADEPQAILLSQKLAGKTFVQTTELSSEIQKLLSALNEEERKLSIRRVFQALRIAVNEEFQSLETLLKHLPHCLKPGGKVAILSFHSGEDRRVKKAFQQGLQQGIYSAIAQEVLRASPEECLKNSRASSAKLRWAVRAA